MEKLKSRRAQGMVEFALLAPIFFLLLLGILDLGRAGFFFVAGSDLARDGARDAAVYNQGTGIPNATVTGLIQQEAGAVGIANANFSMPAGACGTTTPPKPPTPLSACQTPAADHMYFFIEDVPGSPHYKKVSTVYAFRPVTPMLSQITGTIYIVATSAMTVEY
jgi:Flp pilus assembly protein TadG